MTAHTTKLKRIISEMEAIEFNSGSEIRAYCLRARDAQKALAVELEFSASELQGALSELPPPAGESRMKAKVRARTVTRHLRKAAKASRTAAAESTRTWSSVLRQYEHILSPRKQKKPKKQLNLNI